MSKKSKGKSKQSRFERAIEQYWWVFPVVIVGSAMLFAAIVFRQKQQPEASSKVVIACVEEKETNFDCWKERYEAMVVKQSPKEALVDVAAAYEAVPYVKTNCHQIAHIIGRAGGHRYKDVAKAFEQGTDFCSSGYYHGVMEAISADLGVDKVVASINDICSGVKATRQYSLAHHNCVHGLGHGVMAIRTGDLFAGLQTCDLLDDDWEKSSCYGGVFMENIMNEINPGHTTNYLKKDDPLYPCTAVEDRYKQQCYIMQSSHALIVVSWDFSKMFDLCASVEDPYDQACYQSLGRDASGSTSSDHDRTLATCMLGKTYLARDNCFIGAVKDFMWFYNSDQQGLALCNSIPDDGLKQSCITTGNDYYATF